MDRKQRALAGGEYKPRRSRPPRSGLPQFEKQNGGHGDTQFKVRVTCWVTNPWV